MTTLEEFANDRVSAQPEPPREISLWPVLVRSYWTRAGRAVTAVGLLLGVPVLAVSVVMSGSLLERGFLIAIVGSMTVFACGSPAIRAWRVRHSLQRGEVASAEVIRARWLGPRLRAPTVDAQTNGLMQGTWRVHHDRSGDFDAKFESDAPWAAQLRPGTVGRVLVDPNMPRVLLELAPASQAQLEVIGRTFPS
jgi:hypothetical protein